MRHSTVQCRHGGFIHHDLIISFFFIEKKNKQTRKQNSILFFEFVFLPLESSSIEAFFSQGTVAFFFLVVVVFLPFHIFLSTRLTLFAGRDGLRPHCALSSSFFLTHARYGRVCAYVERERSRDSRSARAPSKSSPFE